VTRTSQKERFIFSQVSSWFRDQGLVVRKPVNATLGLKVNQGSYLFCRKEFSKLILTGRLIASNVKT